ncbi:MAG: hypothetical protein IIX01_06065 [Clostridia bacterium]|nr:hypothetical protein [Clostridia bacterium]
MNNLELRKQTVLRYGELCIYLHQKYGTPNSTTEQGLVRHHEDENNTLRYLGGIFSLPQKRKGEKLLQCDVIEHFLLHLKILQEKSAVDFFDYLPTVFPILKEINDFFGGSMCILPRKLPCFLLVKEDFESYLSVLLDLFHLCLQNGSSIEDTCRALSLGTDGEIAEKIYRDLSFYTQTPRTGTT